MKFISFLNLKIILKTINYILILLLCDEVYSQNKINISKPPSWIEIQDYEKSPEVAEADFTQGTLLLLADYQVNTKYQEKYSRFVTKITDKIGIQSGSNINVSFDPSYQKLIFHDIKILRGGELINKLIPEHFQIIRRELNAENYLYDGSLSAVLNMADIRNGDIIDLSYTIRGFNPIHNGKFSGVYNLNDYVPIGKINVSIYAENNLNYKAFNTSIQPAISKKNGLTNYNWIVTSPTPSIYEEKIPSWKIVMPTIVVSEYKSMKEVVKWAYDVFRQDEPLNSSVKFKVSEISKANKTQGEKIKAILNFVQNDIRYLGLEYGIGAYKPNSPNKVFAQRYGDCKDKTVLMVQMLKEINVEAYPMLLNSTMKSTIKELPPSPTFFDHCVVKVIDEDNRELYYDPTLYNQGGTYKNTHFPNYEFGLVVRKNNTAFDTILSSSFNNITTIEEYVLKKVNGNATLNVKTIYTDVEADNMRNYFKNNSEKNIVKKFEDYYANYYSKIKLVDKPSVIDDIPKNEFNVTESYIIDSIWKPMKNKPGFIAIDFIPSSLKDVLFIPNIGNRSNEISQVYPVSRDHRMHIKLPKEWKIEQNNDIVSNDIFYYDFSVDYDKNKNEVHIKNYLKTQKSFISNDEFEMFENDITKLEKTFGYSIYVSKNSTRIQDGLYFNLGKLIFIILTIGALALILIWSLSKKKQKA